MCVWELIYSSLTLACYLALFVLYLFIPVPDHSDFLSSWSDLCFLFLANVFTHTEWCVICYNDFPVTKHIWRIWPTGRVKPITLLQSLRHFVSHKSKTNHTPCVMWLMLISMHRWVMGLMLVPPMTWLNNIVIILSSKIIIINLIISDTPVIPCRACASL